MPVDRQREYETIVIIRPDVGDEEYAEVKEKIEDAVEDAGGHNLKADEWGRRELAYVIQDDAEGHQFERGVYHYYRYIGPGGVVSDVERELKLLDYVLKFMSVKLDDDLIAEERLDQPEEEVVVPD